MINISLAEPMVLIVVFLFKVLALIVNATLVYKLIAEFVIVKFATVLELFVAVTFPELTIVKA